MSTTKEYLMVKYTTLMVDKDVKAKFNTKRDILKMSNSNFLDYLVDHMEYHDRIIQFKIDETRMKKLMEIAEVLIKNGIINDNSVQTVIDYSINNLILGMQNAVGGMEVG